MPLATVAKRLEEQRKGGLYRTLRTVDGTGATVLVNDKPALLLCSNNYLGLASSPVLARAAAEGALQHGASSAASRLVSGSMPLHSELEHAVAKWKGGESALLFNSGYAANTGIISALVGRGDLIFSDRLNHASIIDGALLSGARLIRYSHNDMTALAGLLEKHNTGGIKLIVTDAIFSMDGDLAPLQQLVQLAKGHNALLMVDDAHGGGLLGDQGRGTADHCKVAGEIPLLMGTFGKALGSFGAYLVCSELMRNYLVNRSRSLIFSTSLPPAVLAASLAAIQIVQGEEGEQLRIKVASNSRLLRNLLQQSGFKVPDGITPIIPILVGDPEQTALFSEILLQEGLFIQGIRPPTVPYGTSRLRCTVMASHTEQQLMEAAATITRVGRRLELI